MISSLVNFFYNSRYKLSWNLKKSFKSIIYKFGTDCASFFVNANQTTQGKAMIKKLVKTTLAVSAIAASLNVQAGTVQVGGIQWDTISVNGNESFSATANFQQWISTGSYGTANGVETLTADSVVATTATPGAFLNGIGSFSLFSEGRMRNNSKSFCVEGSGNCELTFAFGGLQVVGVDVFDTSSAWLNIYYDDFTAGSALDSTEFGAVNSTSYSRFEEAQDGMLWASLAFDDFNVAFNNGLIGLAFSSLSVREGLANSDVEEALNVQNGLSDITLTSQVQFSGSNYSTGASDIRPVSAPSTVALAGISLLLIGGLSRRKSK
ncbi:hypothetical protein BM527_13120 [Alteromonas sp. Mex14]|nr:hypothetical protein BM527_13120 [Alteromonas sp. Mex14]